MATAVAVPGSPSTTHLVLKEQDVVKLACEFLQNRDMHISQVTLERESGVINGNYSDDLLFLRQLILDGQWDDILEFIQPLSTLSNFDNNLFQYHVLKAKLVELVCLKSEAPSNDPDNPDSATVDAVVQTLKDIELVAPSKEHYSNLCLLLTIDKLYDHPEYRAWNPSKGRVACFRDILPLVEDLLGGAEKKSPTADYPDHNVATKDRLLQLIIKGILYESCVDYCQQKATGSTRSSGIKFTNVLSQSDFNDSDLSLLSWLQSIPSETFSCPFEQRSLNVDVERIKTPQLDTAWTEHLLITPIKPNTFPHSAMPNTKPKDIMTKSLIVKNEVKPKSQPSNGHTAVVDMSKSLASFHLTGGNGVGGKKALMDTSVDQLFKEGEVAAAQLDDPKPYIEPAQPATKPHLQQQPMTYTMEQPQAPRFLPISALEDVQAIRCAEFHPSGKLFAVGSNSKTLRICAYPTDHQTPTQPTVLFKRTKHHKGSIYCLAWSSTGNLLATGSNDKTLKMMRFQPDSCSLDGGAEKELSIHDGTVRDCLFLDDARGSPVLVSGGAGDCRIHVTDCNNATVLQSMAGHSGHVLSLCSWSGAPVFASGSGDKTVRFWDLRARGCVNLIQFGTTTGGGSPVAACSVDPSGRLLATGHEDSTCILYDIRGGRNVQSFKPHSADVRSVKFSPNAYYLLTAGYDNRLVLTDLQGDLTANLPNVVVAQHNDKVISGRWHPTDFSFISTSADKTATLWALPPL